MIARLFKKSTPLNYSVVIIGVVFFYFLYHIDHATTTNTIFNTLLLFGVLAIIFGSLFITNFIVKKNGLSKDSTYTVLFYVIFLLFFPGVLDNLPLVLANFFILLSMRRMLSLHSLKLPKEKIFDASIWIFVASAFHAWAIVFIALVFISILFHASRDYRNWLLPFVAFVTIAIIFLLFTMIVDKNLIWNLINSAKINLKINYFTSNYQNAALSIYATIGLFFVVSMFLSLSNRPLILHSSYKKIMSAYFVGIIVFLISPDKSNDLLIFTFAPLAIMATSHIEFIKVKWQKDVVIYLLVAFGIFAFFSQL